MKERRNEFACDVNELDDNSISALHYACSRGHASIARLLVSRGASVNLIDGQMFATPLHLACRQGNMAIADFLLRHGADPNIVSVKGYEPLLMATQKGHLILLRALLNAGADVNLISASSGKTALSEACEGGHVKIVDLLLSRDCICNTHTYDRGWSPLMFAAMKGKTASVQLLLKRGGAAINAADFNNRTALYHAIVHSHPDVVAALLDANADVTIAGYDAEFEDISYSPLCRASFGKNRSETIVRRLIAAGADPKDRNSGGMSALMEASRWKHLDIVQYLVEAGANVHYAAPTDGQTALSEACIKGYHDIAAYLLDNGANPNVRNRDRLMALHRAAINNHPRVAHLLAKTPGADLNGKDRKGKTPLFEAADRGHLDPKTSNDHPRTARKCFPNLRQYLSIQK